MQCSRTHALDQFFATVAQANPPVLGLLGCGCSVATEPVAEIVHHWNISQVCPDFVPSMLTILISCEVINIMLNYYSHVNVNPKYLPLTSSLRVSRLYK